MPMPIIASLVASARMRTIVVMGGVRCAVEHRSVNTSLSRKLFFSVCWCIRDAVHLDSRVHAAKPSHELEGNMAKKAKKAKKAKTAKKAKSAVKKTAKKTRKVAKKK
jgi:hypothetical protein